jgi:hypothetical protein
LAAEVGVGVVVEVSPHPAMTTVTVMALAAPESHLKIGRILPAGTLGADSGYDHRHARRAYAYLVAVVRSLNGWRISAPAIIILGMADSI